MENSENKLKQLIEIIKEGKEMGVSAGEILLAIKEKGLVTREVIVEPQPVTSPEKLEYLKEYRKQRKELEKLRLKANKKELVKKMKIDKALKRKSFVCYKCNSHKKVDETTNRYTLEFKRALSKKKIIVLNICPDCGQEMRAFGGWIDVF